MKLECIVTNTLQENAYFLYDGDSKSAVLVDPGGSAEKLKSFIEDNQLDLKGILLTHGHFDHIQAIADIKDFTHAPIIAHLVEKDLLADPNKNFSGQMLKKNISVIADVFLEDGDILEFGTHELKIIHTPGHTRGGCCYYSKKKALLFAGDTLFKGNIGRSDLEGGDGPLLISSIKEKLLTLPDDTIVLPGHGEATTIAHEKTNNYFLR